MIGAGYLGRFHAQKYAQLDQCQLLAVVDRDRNRALALASRFGCRALSDHKELPDEVDAVSVVVPTACHFEVALDCLNRGFHVLLEKPMTATLEQADWLLAVARKWQRILMVGHLERFNQALLGLDLAGQQPLFIESHRLASFKPRSTDVDVVLDLMIHDLDIILELVDSELERFDASGIPVLTDEIDIANARLTFSNGCIANVTASRVSTKNERRLRLFLPNRYYSLDFQARTLAHHWRAERRIQGETQKFREGDALLEEIRHFCECIISGNPPRVPGEAGRRALAAAIEITRALTGD